MPLERTFEADAAEHGLAGRPHLTPANLDGDGNPVFVLSTVVWQDSDHYPQDGLVALDSDGTVRWRTDTDRATVAHHPWFHADAADLDGDGRDEVVHGTSDTGHFDRTDPGCLHLVDADGETVWTRTDYHGVEAVQTGDIDGDGRPEVVAAWKEDDDAMVPPDGIRRPHYPVGGSTYGRYVVYDTDGAILMDRRVGPTAPPDSHLFSDGIARGRFGHHTGLDMGVRCVDLDDDGRDEILAPSGDNDAFRVLAYDGSDDGVERWRVPYEGMHGDDRVWGDLDDDGQQEVIVLHSDHTLTQYDTDGTPGWSYTHEDDKLQDLYLTNSAAEGRHYCYVIEKNSAGLHKIDAATGEHCWTKPLSDPDGNARFGARDLDDDGHEEIVVGRNGRVHCYSHSGDLIEADYPCGDQAADIPGPFGEIILANFEAVVDRPLVAALDDTRIFLLEYRS